MTDSKENWTELAFVKTASQSRSRSQCQEMPLNPFFINLQIFTLTINFLTWTYFGPTRVFVFIRALRPVKIISLILRLGNSKVGRKREIPKKKHLSTHKQNLACLTCDSSETQTHNGEITNDLEPIKRDSNPQRWDDEQFSVLKISSLNHSATSAPTCLRAITHTQWV